MSDDAERGGGWSSKTGSRYPGAWSGLTWGSPPGIRCGCWKLMARWCAGRRACRRSASLAVVERAALAGATEGTRLAVVFEPTWLAWTPIAVFFARRGHDVYRVSSAKAADLRRFLRRHAKSNGIDAETLTRIPLADPGGLQRLELPGAEAAALDRRVRACERLTQAGLRAQDEDQGPGAAADAADPADR